MKRMSEYKAERWAAKFSGADNTAKALINIEVKDRFLENCFWSDILKLVEHQTDPPDNVYSSMLTFLHRPIPEENYKRLLEQALTLKTNSCDTHPCLSDRLKSLGYLAVGERLTQPATLQITAAEYLLGQDLQRIATKFNQDWKEAKATSWRQRYAYLQKIKEKLQALEKKAQTQSLNEQQVWKQAYYTEE